MLTRPPQVLNPRDMSEHITLSEDLMTAEGYGSFRATEPVCHNGVYFYEVTLLASPVIRLGWATKAWFYTPTLALGQDQYSIAFDCIPKFRTAEKDHSLWHNNLSFPTNAQCWSTGDVVGCLIDVPRRNFVFYLNGVECDARSFVQSALLFSDMPYYPAATFRMPDSKARFNFGQQPFVHPPKHMTFKDFYGYEFNRCLQQLLPNPYTDILLSVDHFSAENRSHSLNSHDVVFAYISTQPSGTFYFEVKLLDKGLGGPIKIGWTLDKQTLRLAIDPLEHILWFESSDRREYCKQTLPKLSDGVVPKWTVGDVVGCMVYLAERSFSFHYRTGVFDSRAMQISKNKLSIRPIEQLLPALELTAGQKVYCNFGQERFTCAPKDVPFADFNGNHYNNNNNIVHPVSFVNENNQNVPNTVQAATVH